MNHAAIVRVREGVSDLLAGTTTSLPGSPSGGMTEPEAGGDVLDRQVLAGPRTGVRP